MCLDSWRFKTIVFDFDGTLADTKGDVWDALCFAAEQLGGRLPDGIQQSPANLALPMREIFAHIEPLPPQSGLARFEAETTRYYRLISTLPKTQLYEGVRELLEEINSAGIPCYIVSAKEHDALARVLRLKGWEGYFSECFSPDTVLDGVRGADGILDKPRLLRHIMSLPGTETPVYIGDSATDITAAHAAGMPAIAATYGDGDTGLLIMTKPEFAVHRASELAGILRAEQGGTGENDA